MVVYAITTTEQYNQALRNYPKHIIYFTSNNCPACKLIEPRFYQLAQLPANQSKIFLVVNTQYVNTNLNLPGIPAFMKNRHSTNIDFFVGADQLRLEQLINR